MSKGVYPGNIKIEGGINWERCNSINRATRTFCDCRPRNSSVQSRHHQRCVDHLPLPVLRNLPAGQVGSGRCCGESTVSADRRSVTRRKLNGSVRTNPSTPRPVRHATVSQAAASAPPNPKPHARTQPGPETNLPKIQKTERKPSTLVASHFPVCFQAWNFSFKFNDLPAVISGFPRLG